MSTYFVRYKTNPFGEAHYVSVPANNKEEAYFKAAYEVIPQKETELAYSVWVESVTYKNGNNVQFNTFEGKPY